MKRWRDVIRKDLKDIEVDEDEWYEEAVRSRPGWRAMCRLGMENRAEVQAATQASGVVDRDVVWEECGRTFRRESDKKRHKCRSEREKPVWEQRGATQCLVCSRWFRSKGGMAVHRCS